MSPLFETISIQGGKPYNLELHNARLNRSRRALFGCADQLDIAAYIKAPAGLPHIRCRMVYEEEIIDTTYENYSKRAIRSLKLIPSDEINYSHKYLDRSCFAPLMAQKGNCSDILIVRRGLISDTSFSNVALLGGNQWFTPASPLLAGVQRQYLINRNMIIPCDIAPTDLAGFQRIRLINAMLPWEDCIELSMDCVVI